jgi:hypothetical protein
LPPWFCRLIVPKTLARANGRVTSIDDFVKSPTDGRYGFIFVLSFWPDDANNDKERRLLWSAYQAKVRSQKANSFCKERASLHSLSRRRVRPSPTIAAERA